jgi:hypothetical protein
MPDGDIVHPRLSYGYQKIYKQICEGFFDSETLAYYVLPPLLKDIQKYGNGPINLLQKASEMESVK